MNYLVYDLGHQSGGRTVEVTLSGNAANVRLMDTSNYYSYKDGRSHRYYGGHAKRSPVHITIPHSGQWYVTIDFGGYTGSANASCRVLPEPPGPLPDIQEAPLSSMPSLVRPVQPNEAELPAESTSENYDVFISHASEDKADVVRPLVAALIDGGLKVWFDEIELKIGASLRRKIDKGLANSRFGVVVLSKAFLSKGWTNYELDGLVTKAVTGEQVILPIWHNISKQEVISYSPSLADKLARSTSTHTVQEIAKEIIEVVKGN